jgi:hypothetical protein
MSVLQVVWHSDKGHAVRIPVVLKFESFFAPALITPAERTPEFSYSYKLNADAATFVTVQNSGFSAANVTNVTASSVRYDYTGQYNDPKVGRLNIMIPPGASDRGNTACHDGRSQVHRKQTRSQKTLPS